jgi:DNA replication protein DnaC
MTALSLDAVVAGAMSRTGPMRDDLGQRVAVCEQHGEYSSTGQRFFGRREVWTGCPACAELAQQMQAEADRLAAAKRDRERLEAFIDRAAVPRRFIGRTFDNFTAITPEQQRALDAARGYAQTFDQRFKAGHGLVFSGMPGTGKSHLAAAVLQAVLPRHTGLYTTCMGLIRMVRNTWRRDSAQSEQDVLDMLAGVDLLVIDEIGVQYGTDGEQTVLFEVLDQRYQDQVPTILLTNQDKDGFKGYVGERSFDRLTETSRWVAFDWASHRAAARKAQA